jgi:hypothetical protein
MVKISKEDRITHCATAYRDAKVAFLKVNFSDLKAVDKANDAVEMAASDLLMAAEEED